MADGRDEVVWTSHAQEHRDIWEVHKVDTSSPLYTWQERLPKGAKILDYGCGSGLWRNLFHRYDYYGMDQNEEMIKVAKERDPSLADHFSVVSWNMNPSKDNLWDMVFTAAVIQHNKHEQKKPILDEFARIIKPGGYYMMTENTFREDNYRHAFKNVSHWNEDLDEGYSFTVSGWQKFIEPFGFELVEYQPGSEYLWRKT